jgi:ABC-2 type transport system permease protein
MSLNIKRTTIQCKSEIALVLRNGEQLLLTLIIPAMLLTFFSLVKVLPTDTNKPSTFLLPGVMALAVMSTSMVSLGIGTGFERQYLVLKRLGATPLTRAELVVAKMLSVFAVEVVQFAILLPLGLALGWRTSSTSWPLAIGVVLLGTAAFTGVGLIMAGRLRAEINLAAQNGLYLVLLLLGGMVIPMSKLPSPVRAVAELLPSSALADLMHRTLNGASSRPGVSLVVLAMWAIAAPAVAARNFRWS